MRLLSFQAFSLYANGGGSRILRRLYSGRGPQVISLAVESYASKAKTGDISETIITAQPATRRWMRWYLRDGIIWIRENPLRFFTIIRIRKAASKIGYDILHIVNHGPFSAALCNDTFCSGKDLWVSFHDHFSTMYSNFNDANNLWNKANRRLVISKELGDEYQKLFGNKPYTIITDGVDDDEISMPAETTPTPVVIYFAGLLHIGYMPLFKILADSLDQLSMQGLSFKLLLRGTQDVDFLNNRLFTVEYKPVTLDDRELKNELNLASILYLPIKFTEPDFYLYSLSTKMVGYLGGTGAILYHGPADSAASIKLKEAEAAICCNTLNVDDMVKSITGLLNDKGEISKNAKNLARQSFNMKTIQQEFWRS
jgi:hypothetical protein